MKRTIIFVSIVAGLIIFSKPVYYDDVNRVLDELYSQNYEKALILADSTGQKHEKPIVSDFLKAGIYSTYMSDFETDTLWDSLKKYSERVIKKHDSKVPYDVFFAGGAYLYRTYFYVAKNDYNNTITNGMNALKHFNRAVSLDSMLYDGYLGRGIVNYFIDKFKDRVPFMSPSGDGIREIALAADSGLFTKIPAMDVLAILYSMDKRTEESESISVFLRKNWPENRMFMFTHIKNLLEAKKHGEAVVELENLKANLELNQRKTYVNLAYAYYHLSELYNKLGNEKSREENLSKLLKLKLLTDNKKALKWVKKGEQLKKKTRE
ncbi:MAG: hypothetical protein PHW02_06330 [bacterium]|nr:hypothetical protein [bacterium]